MNEPKPIYTAYECDRCRSHNAIRLGMAIHEDEMGKKFKEVDLCSTCVINFCAFLFRRLEIEDREAFLQAFLSGVMG